MFFDKNDRELEKEIKNHINEKYESVPSFESVMSKCKGSQSNIQKELVLSNGETVTENKNRNLLKVFLPVLLIIAIAVLIITLIPSQNGVDNITKSGYFIIDVNPSLELSYDKSGSITEATPLNEDAEIVLYNLDLKGKKYTDAIDEIVEKLIELGYIVREEKNAVLTTAVNENGEKDEAMTETVKNAFTETLAKCKIDGEVLTGVIDEALSQEAEKYGIDAQKLDLIKRLESLSVEIPTEEYASVSIRELYHQLSEKEKEIKEEAKDKLKEEKEKKKNELNESIVGSLEFLSTIIGEKSEHKSQLDEIIQKAESGESAAEDVLTMLENMELGGFEIFLDMIISFKTGLEDKNKELNELAKELEEANKSLEEKYNERLEQHKQKEQEKEQEKENNKANKEAEKADNKAEQAPPKPDGKQENTDTGKDKANQNGALPEQSNENIEQNDEKPDQIGDNPEQNGGMPEQNKDGDRFGHQNEHSPRDESNQKPGKDNPNDYDKNPYDDNIIFDGILEEIFGEN